MSGMIEAFVNGVVWLIDICYAPFRNYWVAIFLFTLLTKVILLPLSIWIQRNSIKTVRITPELNHIKAAYCGNQEMISEEQYKVFKREKYNPFADLIPLFVQLALLMGVVEAIKKGTDLTAVPMQNPGISLLIPAVAALSAFVMCFVQNRINVLQAEAGSLNQYGTMILSVALSLYLGLFVSVGVGFYWICSNLLSTLQLALLNVIINPKDYIDYEKLEQSKQELKKAEAFQKEQKKQNRENPYRKREKADYKRFFSGPRKKIVFYSEKNGFYKYYKNIIEELIRRTNVVVHYITSDPEDEVFAMESEQFKPYYIGANRLIVLMMKLETDICVMTTPDLENFQLKRSYVRKDIEYVYVPHDVNSSNLTFHKNALDHFDTIFASGPKNKAELEEREQKAGIRKKNIVEWGSSVIDNMSAAYREEKHENDRKIVLVAPSWQKDNIMDSCIEQILDRLKGGEYRVIVRPHPQYVRHYEAKLNQLAEKYEKEGIEIQRDFSSNSTVYTADVLVTDWSSIAFEYAFSTLKPVLFINTPMKVVNPDYQELDTVPIDLELRDKVGVSLEESCLDKVPEAVEKLLCDNRFSEAAMEELREKYIYNVGKSGVVGAKYLIQRLMHSEGDRLS